MNDIINQNNQRDINVITVEIKTLFAQAQNVALSYAIEIGRRLAEAKSVLPHGTWGGWLAENFEFSQSTANNFMKLFDEYGSTQSTLFGAVPNSQTFANLPYSKALQLLALPDGEREDFAKENNVDEMSVRKLKQAIEERNAANERAAELESELNGLKSDIDGYKEKIKAAEKEAVDNALETDEVKKDIENLKTKLAAAEEKYKKLLEEKKNPKIPKKTLDEITKKAEAEAKAKFESEKQAYIADSDKKVQDALNEAEKAKNTSAAAQAELKKAQVMSNPAITEFKVVFEQMQGLSGKLIDSLNKVKDADAAVAVKLSGAINIFAENLKNQLTSNF